MQTNLKAMRKYDAGLVLITIVAVVGFISVLLNLSPFSNTTPKYSQLTYLQEGDEEPLDFANVSQKPMSDWRPVASPVNLGMDSNVHWFSMVVSPTQTSESRFLLHIDYPLLDHIDVSKIAVMISADHSTPCIYKGHSDDPVPLLISGDMISNDNTQRFTEIESKKGMIGLIEGAQVLKTGIDLFKT